MASSRGQRIAVVTAWVGVIVLALTAFLMVGRAYDVWRGPGQKGASLNSPAAVSVAAVVPPSPPRIATAQSIQRTLRAPRPFPGAGRPQSITVHVTFDSKSVAGAKATASSLVPSAFELAAPIGPRTDSAGMLQIPLEGVPEPSGDTPVKVLAYHQDFGTGLAETTLDEAKRGGLIDVKLERGSIVTGLVLGPDGNPVAGAFAQLTGVAQPAMDDSAVGMVSLEGLGAITNDEGVFTIPGIRFRNDPGRVNVQYRPFDPAAVRALRAGFGSRLDRTVLTGVSLIVGSRESEDGNKTFDAGVIQLAVPERQPFPRPAQRQ